MAKYLDKKGVNYLWQKMLLRFKTRQTAKSDPTASGSSTTFIDSITQNENGVITATKKTVNFPSISIGTTGTGNAVIGATSNGHSITLIKTENFKTKQTAKSDPTASGKSVTFIDTISQNANGEITATKKTVDFPAIPNITTGVTGSGNAITALGSTGHHVYGVKDQTFKVEQTAVPDPSASGTATAFIDSITQNKQGVITVTKKNIPSLSKGISGSGNAVTDISVNGHTITLIKDQTFKNVQNAVSDPVAGGTGDEFIATITQNTQGVITATKKKIPGITTGITGTGNAFTGATSSGHTVTLIKGANFKTVQTPIANPTASGNTVTFVDSISQNANGEITATRKTVRAVDLIGSTAIGNTTQPVYWTGSAFATSDKYPFVWGTGDNSIKSNFPDVISSGTKSFAAGSNVKSTDLYSFAFGESVLAQGQMAFAFGHRSYALNRGAIAMGSGGIASGQFAFVRGGNWWIALKLTGNANVTTYTINDDAGDKAFIHWLYNQLGQTSFNALLKKLYLLSYDIGLVKITDSNISKSGDSLTGTITLENTLSSTTISDAEYYVMIQIADGKASVSDGNGTLALGRGSHSEGEQTLSRNQAEHAQGMNNLSHQASSTFGNAGNTHFSIGIGTDGFNAKNAIEIMQNGDFYLYGVGGYNGTNPNTSGVSTLQALLGTFKTKQTAVVDPTASGNATAFIDGITQNANGVITVTKKNVNFPSITVGITGTGNAFTGATSSGHTVTLIKGTNFKTKQTAKADPTASGDSTTFIATITQDENGVITATKKNAPTLSKGTTGSGNAVTDINVSGHTVTVVKNSNFKTVQTAKADPTASGNAIAFIDSISQDTNGVITATKKNITTTTDIATSSSNSSYPSSLAVKTYVDNKLRGAVINRGGFNATNGTINGTSQTLTSVANYNGDMYTCTVAGTYCGLAMEIGDSIIFNKDIAAGTAPTAADLTFVEKNVDVTAGTIALAWNTEVTLATVEGVAIKAKLPLKPTIADLMGSTAIGSATKPIFWNGSSFETTNSINNATFTVKSDSTNVSSFSANASSDSSITFVAGNNISLTPNATSKSITIAANAYPTVNNGKLTFQVAGTGYRDFTANQSGDTSFNFIGGTGIVLAGATGSLTIKHATYAAQAAGLYKIGRDGLGHVVIGEAFTIPTVNNGKITFQSNGTGYRDFTANQSGNNTLNFVSGTGITVSGATGAITITNAGVRGVTFVGDSLRVNTNGTNTDFTVPYSSETGKWRTARTLSLTGSVTGSASIDGSGNVSLATTTNHDHTRIVTEGDNRSTATTPNDYANNIRFRGLKNKATIGSPSSDTYSYLVGLRGWSDTSGGKAHELAFNDSGIYHRIGATNAWGDWSKLVTSSNYTDYVNTTNFPGLNKTGTVTSVTIKGGTGISLDSESAITTSGTRTVSHTTYTAQAAGLYRIGRDGLGHVVIGEAFTIPTVNNGNLYLQADGTTKTTFTANQSGNSTFNIAQSTSNGYLSVGGANVKVYTHPAYTAKDPGLYRVGLDSTGHVVLGSTFSIPSVGNGKITFQVGGTSVREFTANQTGDTTLNFVAGTNISLGQETGKITIGHGTYTAQTAGLYKIGRDATGHVVIGEAFAIPTVNNGTFAIQGAGTQASSFTANQSGNTTLNFKGGTNISISAATNEITIGHGTYTAQAAGLYRIGRDSTGHVVIGEAFAIPTVNNGTLTLQGGGTSAGTFTANQSGGTTVNWTGGTGINIVPSSGTIKSEINSTFQTYINHGETAYNRKYWANVETSATSSKTTEPTFKSATIQNDDSHKCKMIYDSTEECMKFTF